MEILPPVDTLPLAFKAELKGVEIPDTVSGARNAASYTQIWDVIRQNPYQWIPVRCNSMRRAVLLASSALQHRTQPHEVRRRGRVVCIRMIDRTHPGITQVVEWPR